MRTVTEMVRAALRNGGPADNFMMTPDEFVAYAKHLKMPEGISPSYILGRFIEVRSPEDITA